MQENYPPQWVISGNALLRKYDPDLIKAHLELLRMDNFRLTLVSQEFPDGIECTRIERWYSAEYEVQPLSEALVQVIYVYYVDKEQTKSSIYSVWPIFL